MSHAAVRLIIDDNSYTGSACIADDSHENYYLCTNGRPLFAAAASLHGHQLRNAERNPAELCCSTDVALEDVVSHDLAFA